MERFRQSRKYLESERRARLVENRMHKKIDELKFSAYVPEKEQQIIKKFLNTGLNKTDLLSAHTIKTPHGTASLVVKHNDLTTVLDDWLEKHGRTRDEIQYSVLTLAAA